MKSLERTEKLFHKLGFEVKNITQIFGGMSNYNYLVETNKGNFTIRFSGEEFNVNKYIDREAEETVIKALNGFPFTPETIYFDSETGIKITRYLEGEPLDKMDIVPIEKVSELLKKLHSLKVNINIDYSYRLKLYESFVSHKNEKYLKIKEELLSFKLNDDNCVFVHGDSQPSNFIMHKGKVFIIDFEFASKAPKMADIAAFANFNDRLGFELLKEHYKETLDNKKLFDYYWWQSFFAIMWYNVALYKHEIGLSEKLKIDFKYLTEFYLQKAETMLLKAKEYLDD